MHYAQKHRIALIFLGLLWGSTYAWTLYLKKEGDTFPIRSISVEMAANPLLSEILLDKIGLWRQGHLLKVHLSDIYQDIIQFPWVKAAQIWRVWPDQLKIKIEPHQLQAKWRAESSDAVFRAVTVDGVLLPLDKNIMPEDLPILEGPVDRISEIRQCYQQLNDLFKDAACTVKALRLVGDSYWEIRLDNGIAIILGKEGVNEQVVRLIRVLKHQLKPLVNRLVSVDLRYPTGLAVGWKH
jgi:cell division protein FtsQ